MSYIFLSSDGDNEVNTLDTYIHVIHTDEEHPDFAWSVGIIGRAYGNRILLLNSAQMKDDVNLRNKEM